MRVGFFGGTFDPPHRAHVALARLARERLALDRVLVAPVAAQPLKGGLTPATDFVDRVALARLAFAGEKKTEVSLLDRARAGDANVPNYTIDTIAALQAALSPDDTVFLILGADSLGDIRRWRRASELLVLCNFIVGARPGFCLDEAIAALPEGVRATRSAAGPPGAQTLDLTGPGGRTSKLYVLPDLHDDVSATEVRAALGRGETSPALNPAVASYIRAHNLYAHL